MGMGLFMNKYDHPEVYTNKSAIWEQNQRMSTIDPLAEWILEQKEANHALQQQLNDVASAYETTGSFTSKRITDHS